MELPVTCGFFLPGFESRLLLFFWKNYICGYGLAPKS